MMGIVGVTQEEEEEEEEHKQNTRSSVSYLRTKCRLRALESERRFFQKRRTAAGDDVTSKIESCDL